MADADLCRLQRLLAEALAAGDPSCLRAAAPALPADLAAVVAGIDGDGFRLAALLVARLRFERLVRLSARVRAWFEQDPRACTAAFRRYHREVAADPAAPWRDAHAFLAWLDRQADRPAPD